MALGTRQGSANSAYRFDLDALAGAASAAATGWHPVIDRLLARRCQFLDCSFTDGVLFRAIPAGLAAGLAAGEWPRLAAGRGVCAQEAELGGLLLSHELSDALAVARPWERPADAAILVVDAGWFDAALRRREAAVLAFAEPGVVFRYPLLAEPLPAAAVQLAFTCGATGARVMASDAAGFPLVPLGAADRRGCAVLAEAALAEHGLAPARPVPSGLLPRR